MEKSQCFELGYLGKVHGLDGSLVEVLDVDQPERYRKLDAVFLEQGNQMVPYLIRRVSGQKGSQLILSFEGVDSEEQAQKLKGSKLWLPEKALPKLSKDQYYYHELIDCEVEDEHYGRLGKIGEILDLPQQSLASMEWQGAEVLFPLHDQLILRFDREARVIFTRLPEGLLEVYTKPDSDEAHAD